MSEGLMESSPEVPVRPVFLVNREVFLSYASYLRRIFVGLTGPAQATALICPSDMDTQSILCPSVESIEHPALRLPVFWSRNRKILLSRLFRFKPTILHTFYPGQIRLAHWLSQQLDIPFVITCHRGPSRWQNLTKSMHQASGIFAPSGPIADSLRTNCPALKDRIERIHIGSFVEDQCSCFSGDRNVAGFIVAHPLNCAKLFVPFLNAIRHLVLDGSDIMVALMGSGKAERAIREHIWKLGLTSIVTVVPPIRPMRNILSGTDIYVHLYNNPEFDAQLLEAMAVGLAVVGTPETNSGLLKDGHTAMFWDCEDELNIYDCLKKIVGMREHTRKLARNAQAHLRDHNSVSHMVDKLMNTYNRAQQWYNQNRQTMVKIPTSPSVQ